MTSRRRFVLAAALVAGLAPAPVAHASGVPLPSTESGSAGAVAPGGHERFTTHVAGDRTVVSVTALSDGSVLRERTIDGRWVVAPVTFANHTTGLSADGSRLVLVRPYGQRDFPPETTRLIVVDGRTLRPLREVRLRGFFTLDAISPDGGYAYLIQYKGADFLDYRVRALYTATGELAARDVVDPREPDEQMGGLPFTRTMSADGRWAYTLYGGGEEAFIHALDTQARTAACIDLEMLPANADLSSVQLVLSRDGRRIDVRDQSTLKAVVDTRTFAVREPGEAAAAAPEPARADGGGFSPWRALAVAAVLVAVALLLRRRVHGSRVLARRAT